MSALKSKTLRAFLISSFVLTLFGSSLFAQDLKVTSYQGADVASGEIIVRFREANSVRAQALAMETAGVLSADSVGQTEAVLVRAPNRDVGDLLQTYRSRPDVLYAEPNYVLHIADTPNDPSFPQQWGLKNTGQTINYQAGTSGADIHVTPAWNVTTGSRSSVVGIVDTGIDYTHPDLSANMWSAPSAFTVTISGHSITCASGTHGFNAITRTCDPMDDHKHGTHVAGIIGAAGNDGYGITGVNQIASMMGLKFLDFNGSGSITDAIAALEFAIQVKTIFPSSANIRVLNASWGNYGFSQALLDEINRLKNSDMLFVAAAGNDRTNDDVTPFYPAGYQATNIIAVAATDNHDALSWFSNYGPATVPLAAPGSDIYSTLLNSQYGLLSGTSMAAPMVSGAAALLLSACSLTTETLKTDLLSTVDQINSLAFSTNTGGRLDVGRAMDLCRGVISGTFLLHPASTTQVMGLNASKTVSFAVASSGSAGTVTFSIPNLPTGLSAQFNPPTITGAGSSTLTLTTSSGTATGSHFLRITGSNGSFVQTFVLSLDIVTPANAPTVATDVTLEIGLNFAGVVAFASPNGLTTGLYFQVGTTTSYGITSDIRTFTGNNQIRLVEYFNGLSCNALYHYRAVAQNSAGTAYGDDKTFTTLACLAPTVGIGTGWSTASTAGTAGNVNPNGSATTAFFQYGLTTSYGKTAGNYSLTFDITSAIVVSPLLIDLNCQTTYHIRLVAQNIIGTANSDDSTITTLACIQPTVGTGSATNITSTSVSLTAPVDPNGSPTTGYYQYGTTTSYGSTSSIINFDSVNATHYANLTNLSCNTIYHFRLVAQNAAGVTQGTDASFTTLGCFNGITAQPESRTISIGQTATLTVVASGDGQLAYQWYQGSSGDTSVPVVGYSSSYTTPLLTTTTAYWVRVSNIAGSANSVTATVTIIPDVVITNAPASSRGGWYQRLFLRVTAAGAPPLNYQWYQGISGDTSIPVGTNDTYYFTPPLTATKAYWVRVSNATSSVDSVTATVTFVRQLPDFNADGKADLLWYNAETGQTAGWLMNGLSILGSNNVLLQTDPNFKVIATPDFDGDDRSDLLWYNAATGQTEAWLMFGLQVSARAILLTDPDWKVTDTPDFNGDGKADLLWYNAATAETAVWLMDGLSILGGSNYAVLLKDPNWKVTDTPDFNGDGKADLLWYNAATGETAAWLMNGLSILGTNYAVLLKDPNWKVTNAATLNMDATADVLWYNAATGETAAGLMQELSKLDNVLLLSDPNWKVIDTLDFDGDTRKDLLWYNAATGQTAAWLMNGLNPSSISVLFADPNWKTVQTGR